MHIEVPRVAVSILLTVTLLCRCAAEHDPRYGRITIIPPYALSHEDVEAPDQCLLVGGPPEKEGSPWRIAWTSRYILYTPDAHAWYVVDAPKQQRLGPFDRADIDHWPELKDLKLLTCLEAYDRLRAGTR